MQWLQSLFLFSLCWSVGGALDGDSRVKFSDFLKVLTAGTNKQYQRYEAVSRKGTYSLWCIAQAEGISLKFLFLYIKIYLQFVKFIIKKMTLLLQICPVLKYFFTVF